MPTSLHDQAQALLHLLSRAERLEAFPRTGWQACGVQHPESVASHSYNVTLIALWLSDHIDEPVQKDRVVRIALVHDLPEAMLTDLPRPVKILLGRKNCQDAEVAAADRIFNGHPPAWQDAHHEYIAAQSLEARLVKAADRIQMLAKALQYSAEQRGRTDRFFDDPATFNDFQIPLVAEIFDQLRGLHARDEWFLPDFD